MKISWSEESMYKVEILNDECVCASSVYLQIVKYAVAVALQIKIVKEEGDEVVLWCL